MRGTDRFGWVGSIIDGQFAVEDLAGEGASGVVYRGTHLGFELPIAIKCLKLPDKLAAAERASFLSMFRGEARILGLLSRHTIGIVQALDVGAATAPSGLWTPYIVMEWLEGETLEQNIAVRRSEGGEPRGVGAAIKLLAPAAAALSVAHNHGVSHRDIKPANLFLAKSRGGTLMKILDFGIAKVVSEATTLTKAIEQTGQTPRAFTPQYGAPEQFNPRYGATGPWTDVFAMALVFIEVASGRPALPGRDVIQLFISSSDEQDRPSLQACGIAASPDVDAVIRRAVAVSPAARFSDLGEMWAALQAAHDASRPSRAAASSPREPPSSPRSVATAPPSIAREPGVRETRVTPIPEPAAAGAPIYVVMIAGVEDAPDRPAGPPPATSREFIEDFLRAVKKYVEGSGGVCAEIAGARVVARFGGPSANREDAARALLASLRVKEALARGGRPPAGAARPALRVGIATSSKAPRIAARLHRLAPEDAILIDRRTYAKLMGLVNAMPIKLYGAGAFPAHRAGRKARSAYRLLDPTGLEDAIAPSDFFGIETNLVGRAEEMQRLRDALAAALAERRAGLVTLGGPPGSGRSRMLAELFWSLLTRKEAFFVMAARGSARRKARPYALAEALLRGRFGIDEHDTQATMIRKLQRGLRPLREAVVRGDAARGGESPPWSRHEAAIPVHPALSRLVGQAASFLSALARAPTQGAPPPHGSDTIASLLRYIAQRAPLVILCDDAHLADEESLTLLEGLTGSLSDVPALVVCALDFRAMVERRPAFGRAQSHERIHLQALAPRHEKAMIRDRLRRVRELPPEVVEVLADHASGRPQAVLEMLHLLVDAGVLEVRDEGSWSIHAARFSTLALIPTAIEKIVVARLPVGKEAYEAMTEKVRRALHRIAAGWLERRTPDGSSAALLALHYDRGDERRRAAAAYARAAAHALSLHQIAEARMHLSRACEIHDSARGHGPAESAEDRRVASWRERVGVRIDLGDVLCRVGDLDNAERAYEEARSQILRSERRFRALLEPAAALRWEARIDYRAALLCEIRGSLKEAIELMERAIARASEGGAKDETPAMYARLASLYRRAGRARASFHAAARALRVRRRAGPRCVGRDDMALLLLGVAAALMARGRIIGAERSFRQARRAISEDASPSQAAAALSGIAEALAARGDLTGAREAAISALRLRERAGDAYPIAVARGSLAEVELRLLNGAAALQHARRGAYLGEQITGRPDLTEIYRLLAEAALATGRLKEALDAACKAHDLAQTIGRASVSEDAAATLSRVCARTITAYPPGSRLRERCVSAARALLNSMPQAAEGSALHRKVEERRAYLLKILFESESEPRSEP